MNRIYLDHAATTPLDKRVAKSMRDFEMQYFGNPSSTHHYGQQARAQIDFARASVAKFINTKPQEIIFTSGATEANNHAIQGAIGYAINQLKIKPHIITTKLEHQSVYNVVRALESRGVCDATFIQPSKEGLIESDQIIKAIKDNTVLITVVFVSNEIGSVLPIREIGKAIAKINEQQGHARLGHIRTNMSYPKNRILFHTDAVQATKFYNCNVQKLGCDLMTLSGHKAYGPKGIGALYIKTGSKLQNLLYGGAQEYGRRAGTQNSVGIIGMAKAFELLGNLEQRQTAGEKIKKLRDQLLNFIQTLPDVGINGPIGENPELSRQGGKYGASRSPDNLSLTIFDVDQDALMTALDLAGIAASTGSACVSGSSKPSHVIEALGKIGSRQAATVRFTLGKNTTQKEIDFVIKILPQIIKKLRGYSEVNPL